MNPLRSFPSPPGTPGGEGRVRGDNIPRGNWLVVASAASPLTPIPSPPEYRGRGAKERNENRMKARFGFHQPTPSPSPPEYRRRGEQWAPPSKNPNDSSTDENE